MGHALNQTIQDALIAATAWRARDGVDLRTDHAGIATQAVVERALPPRHP